MPHKLFDVMFNLNTLFSNGKHFVPMSANNLFCGMGLQMWCIARQKGMGDI